METVPTVDMQSDGKFAGETQCVSAISIYIVASYLLGISAAVSGPASGDRQAPRQSAPPTVSTPADRPLRPASTGDKQAPRTAGDHIETAMRYAMNARSSNADDRDDAGLSPPWPSGLKRWNQTLVPVVRARFESWCGRPHSALTRNGVRVSVAGTAQRPERVSGRRGPCPAYWDVKLSEKVLP